MDGCYQLVAQKESGEFFVTDSGKEVLAKLKHKATIVAVSGPYRSGKSFILNSLLGINKSGFGVGNTVRACTQGIWIHLKIIENKWFLFLDVEGFGSTDKTNTDDAKLFAMALMCSSLVVYNSVGVINENKLRQLTLALSYCEIINSQLTTIFSPPKLIWLLRDFVLELETPTGESITASQYLERVLKDESKVKNQEKFSKMREIINSTFSERVCITLPRPVEDEEALQNLENIPFDSLRLEFQKGFKKLKKIVFSAEPKQVSGKNIRGKDIINLLNTVVESINSGTIPDIPSAWESIVQSEYSVLTEQCIDEITHTKNLLQTKIPIEDEDIIHIFRIIKEKSDSKIIDCHFRDEVQTRNAIEKVTKMIEVEVEELVEVNRKACLEFNVSLLYSLFPPFFFSIESGEYENNLDKLEDDWSHVMEQFESRSKGSGKFLAISEFSKRGKMSELGKKLADVMLEMQNQINQLKIQEKQMQWSAENPMHKTNEELRTEIAYNRYRMKQFNQQVKIIQKRVLQKL